MDVWGSLHVCTIVFLSEGFRGRFQSAVAFEPAYYNFWFQSCAIISGRWNMDKDWSSNLNLDPSLCPLHLSDPRELLDLLYTR